MAPETSSGVKRFYGLLGGLTVAGIAVLGYFMSKAGAVSIPAKVVVTAADTAGFRGYLLGSPTAPVEITEYADYQCPACASFEGVQFPTVKQQLIETGKVRWRYRDFPLEQHAHARVAAHAAACANEQGKFWELHRFIYEGQSDWAASRSAANDFRRYAGSAGVDLSKYDACMKSARYAGRIQASNNEGLAAGVSSTPTFLIGGRLYPGALSSDRLKFLVDSLAAHPAK